MDKVNGMKKKYMIAAAAVVLLVIVIAIVMGRGSSAKKVAELLDLGNKYLLEQDYEQAVVAFEKLIEIDPKNVDAYLGLADAYVGMGNTEEAIAALEKGYGLTSSEEILKKIEELGGSVEAAVKMAENTGAAAEMAGKEPAGEASERSDEGVYQTIAFDGDTEKMIDSIIASCVDGQYEKVRDMMEGDAFKNVLDQYGYLDEPSEYSTYSGIIRAQHKEARVCMQYNSSTNFGNNCLFVYLPQSGEGFIVTTIYGGDLNHWGYAKGDVKGYSFNGAFYEWDWQDGPIIWESEGTLVDNCYEGKVISRYLYAIDAEVGIEYYSMYENGRLMSLGDDPYAPGKIIIARGTNNTETDEKTSNISEEFFKMRNQNRNVCIPGGFQPAPAPWEERK